MKKISILLFIGLFVFTGFNNDDEEEKSAVFKGYPVPKDKNMLFYIQKSFNTNAVVYTANIGADGKLNPEQPVNVFWRRYQEDGGIKPLKYLEKKLAFGVNFSPIEGKENAYVFTLASLKGMKLYITQDKKGVPQLITTINNQPAKIERVFVTAEHVSLLPKVFFLEIFGRDAKTGAFIYEKVMK
jgi:hypothetical protein